MNIDSWRICAFKYTFEVPIKKKKVHFEVSHVSVSIPCISLRVFNVWFLCKKAWTFYFFFPSSTFLCSFFSLLLFFPFCYSMLEDSAVSLALLVYWNSINVSYGVTCTCLSVGSFCLYIRKKYLINTEGVTCVFVYRFLNIVVNKLGVVLQI